MNKITGISAYCFAFVCGLAPISTFGTVTVENPPAERTSCEPTFHSDEAMRVSAIEACKLERSYWTSIGCKFGDTAGYMNGEIEFNLSTRDIHNKYWHGEKPKLLSDLATKHFLYSDDTIFCDMTKSVLRDKQLHSEPTATIVTTLVTQYIKYKEDPLWSKRAHGNTMQDSLEQLQHDPSRWAFLPYKAWKAGCGAAMRTMPIGEVFSGKFNRQKLMEVSLASSYATHSNPKGFLGGVASALFTSLACENRPFSEWVPRLQQMVDSKNGIAFPFAINLIKPTDHEESFLEDWHHFEKCCSYYFNHRFNETGSINLESFPDTPDGRDRFYIQLTSVKDQPYPWEFGAPSRTDWAISQECWPGAKGNEAPLMAYDALILTINKFLLDNNLSEQYPLSTITPLQFCHLLKAAGPAAQEVVFKDLLERACLHGGDSDSTGAIAFYIQAAILKEMSIPKIYLQNLEPSIF